MDDVLSGFAADEHSGTAAHGVPIDSAKSARVEQIRARLAQLADAFTDNVAQATVDWTRHVPDELALEGMSERDKQQARRCAQAAQLDGFLLRLAEPGYRAALHQLADRALRKDLYEAHATRASDHGPRAGRFDNSALVQEALALRHELALLLGYESYAALALAQSPLREPDQVERFLLRNGAEGRARAQAELDAIWAFAKEKGAPKGFSSWDLGYYADWLKRERGPLGDDELCGYFVWSEVVAGLFALCERLLGLTALPCEGADPAANELCSYQLRLATGEELGKLELGLCPPVPEQGPPLLSHAQVCALFQRAGKDLYLMLSGDRDPTASEIAGHYFELFSCHFETLTTFARHHARADVLPRELFEKLMWQRNLHAGLAAAQQRELLLFDLRVHRDYVPAGRTSELRAQVLDILAQVRSEVCVLRPPFWERMANTCTAIFAGERAGRLWEMGWAQQVAQELFDTHSASGFDHELTRRLRDTLWSAAEQGVVERLTNALGRAPRLLP